MSRMPMAKSKNGYQSMLWTYLSRREKIREQYANKDGYEKRVLKLNYKIRSIRNAILRFDKRESRIGLIHEAIIEFNGVDIKNMPPQLRDSEKINTRYSFYKFCIENGIRGNWVASWLNMTPSTPSRGRTLFTRSFKTNIKNRDFYRDISRYIREYISQ